MFDELQEIAESLAAQLNRSVAIDDSQIRLLVHTAHQSEQFDKHRLDSIMQKQGGTQVVDWVLEQGVSKADRPVRLPANDELGMMSRVCVPIRCQNYLFGYLWLIDSGGPLTEDDLKLASRSADSAGEVLFRAKLMGELKRGRERELLSELLSSDPTGRDHAAQQLVLGDHIPTGAAATVIALEIINSTGESFVAIELALQHAKRRLAPLHVISTVRGGTSALILVAGRQAPELSRVQTVANQIRAELSAVLPETDAVVLGIGTMVGSISEAHESRRCAEDAANVAKLVSGYSPVAAWDELEVYQLLVQLPLEHLRGRTIAKGLRRLLDADHTGNLVESLETYLEEACSVPNSIARLNVHRTSLYYRLNKIEEITGMSLSDGNDRLSLHLGIKLTHLLGFPTDDK